MVAFIALAPYRGGDTANLPDRRPRSASQGSYRVFGEPSLQHDVTRGVEQHRDALVIEQQQVRIVVDIDEVERNARQQGDGVLAEMTALPGEKAEVGAHDPKAIVTAMRPFTTIVVIGLVVLIVGAFVVKLATTGLSP
jgi:hypothetical protein